MITLPKEVSKHGSLQYSDRRDEQGKNQLCSGTLWPVKEAERAIFKLVTMLTFCFMKNSAWKSEKHLKYEVRTKKKRGQKYARSKKWASYVSKVEECMGREEGGGKLHLQQSLCHLLQPARARPLAWHSHTTHTLTHDTMDSSSLGVTKQLCFYRCVFLRPSALKSKHWCPSELTDSKDFFKTLNYAWSPFIE